MALTTRTEARRCKRAAVGRLSERAGRNASERRAGLETVNAEADPPRSRGRLPATGNAKGFGERSTGRLRRGNGDGMYAQGSGCNMAIPLAGTLPT